MKGHRFIRNRAGRDAAEQRAEREAAEQRDTTAGLVALGVSLGTDSTGLGMAAGLAMGGSPLTAIGGALVGDLLGGDD